MRWNTTTKIAVGFVIGAFIAGGVAYSAATNLVTICNISGSSCASVTTGSLATTATFAAGSTVAIDQTTPGTTNGVQVNAALPAGTALMGKVGIDQTTPGTTNGVQVNAALPVGSNVIGGVTSSSTGNTAVVSSSAENNHVLKNAAGTLFTVYAVNLNTTTAAFLDILNVTSTPSDGAVAPLDFCYLPPSGSCSITYSPFQGASYSTGITAVITSATTPLTKTTGTVTGLIVGHIS
jgi:hypothetical protein